MSDAAVVDLTALPAMDIAGRLGRLRDRLAGTGCEGLLVTSLTNIRYLTGFTGSAGLLLVLPDDAVLVSDGRYRDQAEDEIASAGVTVRIEITTSDHQQILSAATAGMSAMGLEADDVSWAMQRRISEEWLPDLDLVPTSGLVEGVRLVKDEGEIARIEAAASIADTALAQVWPLLATEPTERAFALELDTAMRRLGAKDVSFETICASGPNSARPHARPSDRRMVEGDLVVLDFGALLDGYHSDMTRTVILGEPDDTQQRLLDVVIEAQQRGVERVGPGVECRAVDAACREFILDAGWGEAFLHGTGHGVGLDIHEDPRVAGSSSTTLEVGEVVTVEPGVYLTGIGGVRIEDTLLVTADGNRPLTHAPKQTRVA